MSFYRTLLAAVATMVIAAPVFADDSTTTNTETNTPGTAAMQPSDNSGAMQSTTTTSTTTDETTTTTTKVDVNKATAKDLMKIKGINASKARAIVAYRKKHGDFKSIDDLANVKGFKKMKPDTMKEIQDQLAVE